MASVVQYGRRTGSTRRVVSADEPRRMIQPSDLDQVTVLTKADWLRIQDELNQANKERDSMREEAKQRENLHLKSKEVVKTWSNTIAGQRQKKLEAKKIREQLEEEKRKQIDKEEAEYKEQKRKEDVEKAKTQLYYQTDHVKGLHRALLLTEVLKEREAQIEMKQRIQSAYKDVDDKFVNLAKTQEEEALKNEQEKSLEKKLERRAFAEDLKNKIKENELVREQQKIEIQREEEEILQLQELYRQEQRLEEERQAKQKRDLMQAHLEHLSNRNLMNAADVQKQEAEEQQRKLFLSAKQKMMKLRKEKEKEILKEAQERRERIMDKLTVKQQEQTANEEERIAKAAAEQEAKVVQQQQEEHKRRVAMLNSIAAHRELMRQEKEQRDKMAEEKTRDSLQAKKEADRIFLEKQKLKAQQIKEDGKKLKDFNATQIAEKSARHHRQIREEYKLQAKHAELSAEEEKKFLQYSQQVIKEAADGQRNVFPLVKAARDGIGGGPGPISAGVRHSYLVQDRTGAQMPQYVSGVTQNIKKLNEAADIEDAKKRLGFTW